MITNQRKRAGLTLLEVMLSLILISSILLVTITASANLFRSQSEIQTSVRGFELAGVILDEVSVKRFRDIEMPVFGLESDESVSDRTTLDDVDDYHNLVISPPTYHDGEAIPGFTGWSVNVNVGRANATTTGLTTTNNDDSPLRIITVTCTAPNGATTVDAIAVSEAATPDTSDFSHSRQTRVQLGFPAGRDVHVSAPLRNLPEVTRF